jgi:hypothetical protein
MKRNLIFSSILALILALSGCVAGTSGKMDTSSINRVALVSLSISDWGGSIKMGGVGRTPVAELIAKTANKMRTDTEEKLASKWQVVKASSFVGSQGYRALGTEKTLSVIVPEINGKEMAVFTQVSKEIKGGQIAPQIAMDLCKTLQVDAVVLVFSEWTVKTGGIVPITKAVSKNIFTIWDANGKQVTKKRVDMMGTKPLGAYGVKAVNENTISEWHASYDMAMNKIIGSI